MKNTEMFYDEVSLWYNEMVNYDESVKKREAALKKFVKPEMKTAADIGCGTGIDSIALSKLGLDVTAFDISSQMINQAKNKSAEKNLAINYILSSADEIPVTIYNGFQLIVSLGNTMANLTGEQLEKSLGVMYNMLEKGGTALLQILNFTRILDKRERIVNITRSGDYYYTRFYDFLNDKINFNILRFHADNPSDRIMETTVIYPYNYKNIIRMIKSAGFSEVKLWGNLNREDFIPEKSTDLVVEVIK
jgi:ubiquinone/menaquinone biosynthesis C-methylase UbiE